MNHRPHPGPLLGKKGEPDSPLPFSRRKAVSSSPLIQAELQGGRVALLASAALLISVVSTAYADTRTIAELPAELASPACIACNVDVMQARQGYSDSEWKTLENREVVIAETPADSGDPSQHKVRANVIIDSSPQQVWAVLTDFPSRPKFTPDLKDMRVVRVVGKRVWVDEYLKFLVVDIRFRVINTLEPNLGTMSWELDKSVEHDIADTKGAWQLTPVADGRQTLLSYWADVDTGQPVPDFIERYLMRSSLPNLLGRMRDEVERRFPNRT